VFKTIAKADVTIDLLHVGYDQAINGVNDAYTAVAAAGYALTPKARIVADVDYSKNPEFNKDVRGMLTFVYDFDGKLGGAAKATPSTSAAKPVGKKP
jgi:putative NIF3 family GTP cyclohydrolase 1 type 2